jgi:hypothetical protein
VSVHHALWSGDQQMHPGGAARFGLGDNTLNRPTSMVSCAVS